MRQIRIPLEYFDIEAFLNETIDYLKKQVSPEVHPTYGIVWVESPGHAPVYGPETGWDVIGALNEEGKTVFFAFAKADEEARLLCADGNTYGPASDHEESEGTIMVGETDSLGYLIKIEGGLVVINSAIHAGGACVDPRPSVYICETCQGLAEPIAEFLWGFVTL